VNSATTPTQVRRRPVPAGVAVALLLSMLLSGCSALGFGPAKVASAPATAGAAAVAGTPPELARFYTQAVQWQSCEKEFECASVTVPLDYTHPEGGTIQLAVIKQAATGQKQGSLLVNPGGPGASGYDLVRDGANTVFSPRLRSAYDVVGFDPRGVQRSAPVKCIDDAARDAERQETFDLNNDADLAREVAEDASDVQQCVSKTGDVLRFVDTPSSARDMDILRALVNDQKLNYMGFSYGTKLGATYAELFPARVGKFSLDGALDPSLGIEDISAGQAKGFETALHSWAADCLTRSDCPVSGSVEDAVGQVRDLNAAYTAQPQKTNDGRLLTGADFNNALAYAMYSTELWAPLRSVLGSAMKGNPNPVMALADYAAERGQDGKYTSNTAFAFNAINCLDYPMTADVPAMRAEAAHLEQLSPTFGELLGYSGLTCANWPYPAVSAPHRITAEGAGPILVVGTTRDPATPYEWAVSLSEQLSSGVLVTWDGDGHTAYGRANACLTNTVDDYFVDGKVPAEQTRC
jgi:pimeloyl-ACP methyl ester carboxylesterase